MGVGGCGRSALGCIRYTTKKWLDSMQPEAVELKHLRLIEITEDEWQLIMEARNEEWRQAKFK